MGWTKRQLIQEAFTEIGLGQSEYDPTPDELRSALRRLDAMIGEWDGRGIRLGYPLPGSPDASNLDADTAVPDWAVDAILVNLAIRIAPSYGKQIGPETRSTAAHSFLTVIQRSAIPPPIMQMPGTMPRGAGQKPHRINDPFVNRPVDPILAGGDGELEFD